MNPKVVPVVITSPLSGEESGPQSTTVEEEGEKLEGATRDCDLHGST